jgi:hypothetical protein
MQDRRIVAAVVDEPGPGGIGELLRLDEVLEANLGRVHTEFSGQAIDDAFDAVRGFGTARAAIGIGGESSW